MKNKIDIIGKMSLQKTGAVAENVYSIKRKMIKESSTFKSINFEENDLSRCSFRWFSDLSKESFHISDQQFVNFIKDTDAISNDSCAKIARDAQMLLRTLKSTNLQCLRNATPTKETTHKRKCRVRKIFIESDPDIGHFCDMDIIYKFRPVVMNEEVGCRIFATVLVDDSDVANLVYLFGVFLIDLYHLVIPSSHKEFDTSTKYTAAFYQEFKNSNINIYNHFV